MEWWLAILLGLLQGVTEWLPISSSGHLAIFQYYFDEKPPILFDIILHLGSLFVIIYIMKKELIEIVKAFPRFLQNIQSSNIQGDERIIGMVIVASFPTAIIGFGFDKTIIGHFYSEMHLVGICLIFTGVLVWLSKDYSDNIQMDDFPIKNALVIGFFQGLAILPGISRSGSTIAVSKILGMNPVKAARFSFLLFIPAIIGAMILKIGEIDETVEEVGILPLFLGFITSMITSYLAINALIALIRKQKFHYFTPYCFVLGLILVFDSLN